MDWLAGRSAPGAPGPSRHERRAAAKRRHRETGAPLWTAEDRLEGPSGTHGVADVAPGTPGHYGSVRTVDDD